MVDLRKPFTVGDQVSTTLENVGSDLLSQLRQINSGIQALDRRLAEQAKQGGLPAWEEIPANWGGAHTRYRLYGLYVVSGGTHGTVVTISFGQTQLVVPLVASPDLLSVKPEWVPVERILERGVNLTWTATNDGDLIRIYMKASTE